MKLNSNFTAYEECWMISYGVGKVSLIHVLPGQQYTSGQPILEWYKTEEAAFSRMRILDNSWKSDEEMMAEDSSSDPMSSVL